MSEFDLRVHGGVTAELLAELGSAGSHLLDLSVNVNPFGPHPEVARAAAAACLAQYPDPTASAARLALASAHDVDPARVIVGHGSAELLWTAVAAAAGSGKPLLSVAPSFSEPLAAARAYRLATVSVPTHAADDFALDPNALDEALATHTPSLAYLCQPNNPSGHALEPSLLRALFEAHPRTCFVLDQAFLSLSTRHADAAIRFGDNVVQVRSLTKDHGLPGLRVGYALAAPERVRALQAHRPAWMVSAPAQAAIIAACTQPDHVRSARQFLLDAKAALAGECARLGLQVIPSCTHFFLVRVGDADALRQRLLERHAVLVRSGSSFGLPEYIRVAGCAPSERARFCSALRAELRL